MSALPKFDYREVKEISAGEESTPRQGASQYVKKTTKLSRKKRPSANLQLLIYLQRASSGLALVMMSVSIALYLVTVRIPQLWSQEYDKLNALQRQERELVAVDETLKYELAKQAEQPELELSPITPDSVMFLPINSVQPQIPSNELSSNKERVTRLGY